MAGGEQDAPTTLVVACEEQMKCPPGLSAECNFIGVDGFLLSGQIFEQRGSARTLTERIHFGIMKKSKIVGLCLLVLPVSFLFGDDAEVSTLEPEVLRWLPGDPLDASALPAWADQVAVTGGRFFEGQWIVGGDAAIGEGRIDIEIDPGQRPLALALTFAFEPDNGGDLAMQLYDDSGALVAVDLFGDLVRTASVGQSDTFIVPMSKYPDARRVSIRRIQGSLTFNGFIAFPVITELDALSETDRAAIASMLGESLVGTAGLEPGADSAAAAPTRIWIREAEDDERLEALLADPDYPLRRSSVALAPEFAFPASVSGTTYRFFTNLYLPLFSNPGRLEDVAFVSSSSSNRALLSRRVDVALSSYPPKEAELATFAEKHGFRPLVLPIALDAVDILVHPENRLEAIDFADLREIYSEEVRLKKGRRWWDGAGVRGPIVLAGGRPSWGTSRFFADQVLEGDRLSEVVLPMDVAYPHGVERFVANNRNAIGFAQHRTRTHAVKALSLSKGDRRAVAVDALTVARGDYPLTRNLYLLLGYPSAEALPEPVRRFADQLLSKEGQRAVAATGSYALPADEVRRLRQLLLLD